MKWRRVLWFKTRFALALVSIVVAGCAAGLPHAAQQDPHPGDGYYDHAVPVVVDEWVADRIGPQDADDWKSFALPESGRVQIALANQSPAHTLTVKVYRQDGRAMGTLVGEAGRSHSLVGNFAAGTYYMEIVTEAIATDVVPYIVKIVPL